MSESRGEESIDQDAEKKETRKGKLQALKGDSVQQAERGTEIAMGRRSKEDGVTAGWCGVGAGNA